MRHTPLYHPPLLMLSALILGACAQLPNMGSKPDIKDIHTWESQTSLAGHSSQWPQEQWWNQYHDAQLNHLIEDALAGAPSLAAAEARLRRAAADVEITDAATSPQLSANADINSAKQSYNYLTPKNMVPKGEHGYGRATLDFSWEIDFWGRNRAALAAATSQLTAAQAETAQARLILTTSITSAYAELARLFAAQDTANAALTVREKTAKLFHERYDNGLETLGSVKQAEARYSAAQANLLSIQEQLALQRNQLAALIGKGPDYGLGITRPQIDLSHPAELPQSLELQLIGRRPDVVAARLRAEAASRRIDVAQADFYPNINLNAYIGVQSLGLGRLAKAGSSIGSIGPALSLPIFNGGRLRAQLKSARADYDEAVANYEQTVTEALQSVADTVVSQRQMVGQLKHTDDAVQASREAWEIAHNRYTGGLSSYIDVLTVEDTLISNLRQQSDLQSRAFTLDVALIRALGGGFNHQK